MPDAFSAKVLPEVSLAFGDGHIAHDQKVGIANYGPCSPDVKVVRVAVIGDERTTRQFLQLVEMAKAIVPGKGKHPLWTQDFPGLGRDVGFRFELVTKSEWTRVLNSTALGRLEKLPSVEARIGESVKLFADEISKLQAREDAPNVFVCAPPEHMMKLCLPKAGEGSSGPKGRKSKAESRFERRFPSSLNSDQRSLVMFSGDLADVAEQEWQRDACDNFHHALKIKAMDLRAPTQFIKPFTLDRLLSETPKGVQDAGTFCWNIFTACYYKAGGTPWRLDVQAGTCFIGIAFFVDKRGKRRMGTSLAQVFTHDGEGLVVRGESFEWPRYSEPHLSQASMARLVAKAREAYEHQMESSPRRVVIHKTSTFDEAEAAGARTSLDGVPRYDLLTIREHHDHKVFRSGYNPVLRGTAVDFPDGRRLLFTRGYLPSMQVYPGPRVPRPIEILFDDVSTPRDQLCSEILGLTRLNWNSADFASNLPMTLQFAKQVNKILRELPKGAEMRSRYRYYI